ncbi:MAG: MBL fold metallo-hydrolase, partial [Bacteroidota bacterium]
MELYSVHIANFKVDGGVMFGVVPKYIWNKKYFADEDNLINLAL